MNFHFTLALSLYIYTLPWSKMGGEKGVYLRHEMLFPLSEVWRTDRERERARENLVHKHPVLITRNMFIRLNGWMRMELSPSAKWHSFIYELKVERPRFRCITMQSCLSCLTLSLSCGTSATFHGLSHVCLSSALPDTVSGKENKLIIVVGYWIL